MKMMGSGTSAVWRGFMNGNDKSKWWKIVVISLLIIVPVTAVIVAFFLLNRDSKRVYTIKVEK